MANLLLTRKCSRTNLCPYCFAKEEMSKGPNDFLKWDDLIYIADLLELSKEFHISLLGGEPTLHPNFVEFVLYLIERDIHVNVFTNGIMGNNRFKEAKTYLKKLPEKNLSFVCNLNHPSYSNRNELENVNMFLKHFGHLTTASFNIHKPDFNMEFLFEYIKKYNMKHHIRIGLTHAIVGENNVYLSLDKMPEMADNFMKYYQYFEKNSITAGFDCGVPMCIFDNEDLGKLYKISRGKLKFSCGPAIDIGPEMDVWACFPLSDYNKKSLYDFNSFNEIRDYYQNLNNKIRSDVPGIFSKCRDCKYLNKRLCAGGCLAHILNKNYSIRRLYE